MASLVKFCKIPTQLSHNKGVFLYAIVRNKMNRTYKPGPYPQTEAERKAAAEKYGMLPEDYKPIPDDGNGYGDYPDLPVISTDAKSDYYPWDEPVHKRNYGEPMHILNNIYSDDRYDASAKLRYPMWVYWTTFLGTITGFTLLMFFCEKYTYTRPLAKKQMPMEGVTHYTFEPLK